eukprot:scaffold1954_cov268-Pinguiococcus_pyrenoidosus.AAC.305
MVWAPYQRLLDVAGAVIHSRGVFVSAPPRPSTLGAAVRRHGMQPRTHVILQEATPRAVSYKICICEDTRSVSSVSFPSSHPSANVRSLLPELIARKLTQEPRAGTHRGAEDIVLPDGVPPASWFRRLRSAATRSEVPRLPSHSTDTLLAPIFPAPRGTWTDLWKVPGLYPDDGLAEEFLSVIEVADGHRKPHIGPALPSWG